ncbi:MAG: molybdopterin synthase sulfur carrier subunit [Dehalococcoidia bacterium]|nr:molybdopterin synthase sulfur carrier subunit [Dehalococcoidia bacterium]
MPSLLRPLCDGASTVEAAGANLGELIAALDAICPGIAERLLDEGSIRPELAFFVDGEPPDLGLLEPVRTGSEVQILPALGGG